MPFSRERRVTICESGEGPTRLTIMATNTDKSLASWIWVLCLAVMCASAAAQPAADVAALEAAAQRGDVPALMTLAGIYERGENVEQDFTRSNALYCKAAA